MMKKNILVVEDFTSVRHFICDMLSRNGYGTYEAANGNEALSILSQNGDISLVVTDYNMPECTGLELLKKMKTNPETETIPVIFLTAELSQEKLKLAKEAGLTGWIKKPYRSDIFFAQIESAVSEENNVSAKS
jgi:two-component system chemotaxis response regulator CheY